MDGEGVSSLAVVDNQFNVVGNISTVDVKVRTFLHLISCVTRLTYASS